MSLSEFITVEVAGQRFTGWESVSARASVKEAVANVHLRCALERGAPQTHRLFALYAEIKVYSRPVAALSAPDGGSMGDLLFTGNIFLRRPRLLPKTATLDVEARSRGAQAVDCSHRAKTGKFVNKTPLAIAQELDDLGIGFETRTKLQKILKAQAQPGASLFREIERHCRDQGLVLSSKPDGGIAITRPGETAARAGALVEGQNIREAVATHNGENRHSMVTVRGQKPTGHGKEAIQAEQSAQDEGVPLNRPLVLHVDGDTDQGRLKARAEAHRDRAAGQSLRAQISIPGWRDEAGRLYRPGDKVWVQSPTLDVQQDMIIESIDYAQSGGGEGGEPATLAHIDVVDPRTYGGKASKASKSGPGMKMPSTNTAGFASPAERA